MNPQDEALCVTQADEIAISNCHNNHDLAVYWRQEAMKARHRLSHSTPGDAEVRKAGRFTIEDDTFVEVRGLVSGHVYLWQTAPDTGDEAQINLSPQGAARLAQELAARIATPSGRAQGEVIAEHDREMVRRLVLPMVEERSRERFDAWDLAHSVLKRMLYAAPPAQDQGEGR